MQPKSIDHGFYSNGSSGRPTKEDHAVLRFCITQLDASVSLSSAPNEFEEQGRIKPQLNANSALQALPISYLPYPWCSKSGRPWNGHPHIQTQIQDGLVKQWTGLTSPASDGGIELVPIIISSMNLTMPSHLLRNSDA